MKIEIPDKELGKFLECVRYGVEACARKHVELQEKDGYCYSDPMDKVVLTVWRERVMAGLELLIQYPDYHDYDECYLCDIEEAINLRQKIRDEEFQKIAKFV